VLTVRELLRDLDVRLLCGEAATDLLVRWVHISELKDPTPWLSGGELLLTTGMQLNTAQRQRDFVNRLADHQLAGLGFGVGFGHREVPAALMQAATEREFPVFEVPYEVPFIAVTEAAFTQLVNEQYAVLRRALSAHERLERVVLSQRGLLRVGVGRAVAGGEARRSFHEARCAVEAVALGTEDRDGGRNGAANGNPTCPSPGHHVATYRDLGSFQLLLSLQEDEALRLFCDSILGPIEACERHYGGELMRSLEAFIEENGQWERAAKRLYCHRHTLRYRIRRVEELTGRDLHSARDRIEFWLALRGRELVA
jgi:DNA-binding PucR family transcriptional regulator